MNLWQRLRHRKQLELEMERELRLHLEQQVQDNIRAGMSDEEARRAARLQFGGLDHIKELCRDAWGTRWVYELLADGRFAVRLLAKERVVSTLCVVALGLGIGVNSTFFSVVSAVCLRGLPIPAAHRVIHVGSTDAAGRDQGVSYADFTDLRAGVLRVASLAAFMPAPFVVADTVLAPDRVGGAYVTANTFDVLREPPILGRGIEGTDDRPGAPPVVVLGERLWRARYGADASVLGRTIRVNGRPAAIVGVIADSCRFPLNATIWQPMILMPGIGSQARSDRSLGVVGRVHDGANLLEVNAQLAAVAAALAERFPPTNRGVGIRAVPINERYTSRLTEPVWLAFITAGLLVLLVAFANTANLLLLRAARRSREIAVRVALGATRLRVMRQLAAESAVICVLGGILGLCLAVLGARLLSVSLTDDAPYWIRFTMDVRGFLVLSAVCLSGVLVFGLAPVLHVRKTDVSEALQEGGRSGTGGQHVRRWTAVLLTGEFAMTMVLLAAVVVGWRNFRASDTGESVAEPSRLLTLWISLPGERYPTPESRLAAYQQLRERLSGVGTISSTAAVLTFALVAGSTAPGAAHCARSDEGDICAGGSPWYEFTRLTVQPSGTSVPSTRLTLHGGRDLSVDVKSAGENGPHGRMIVVDGRALLMRDVQHEAGYEADALDGQVLMSQLVVTLLDQAFPEGPASVRATHPVKVEQKARAIRIATASAEGRFEPPWALTGTVRRQGERIENDLRFSARTADRPYSFSARGLWQKKAKPAPLDEDMPLDGWTVHWLGRMTATAADGTTLDYAAHPASRYWHDVAALRKWISEEPARRAARRRTADASNPGLQQSITYEAFVTVKNGARRSVGTDVREYKPGSDVLIEEAGHDAVSKTLSLGHGLSISTDVYREAALTGFGLVLVNDASPCFSWEWFDRDSGDVFRKLKGDAKIRVTVADGAGVQELAAIEFLDDVVLKCEDHSNGTVYEAQLRRGSVLRLRP